MNMTETVTDTRAVPDMSMPESIDDATVSKSGAAVIINADDWGIDRATTGRTLDCFLKGAISSASAMVFMEDSERASDLAREHQIDCGLHLNLTAPFSAPPASSLLREHQRKLTSFLRSHRYASIVYHPFLASSFDYVVHAQLEEFERLYGSPAARVDGHHHMHLSANVVGQKLLPAGIIVRRNYSFAPGEKNALNRWYRARQDRRLARRHRMTDFFFSLPPLEPASRLEKIFNLAMHSNVELETHPINQNEFNFLTGEGLARYLCAVPVARGYHLLRDASMLA
jgi:hypothetical protein